MNAYQIKGFFSMEISPSDGAIPGGVIRGVVDIDNKKAEDHAGFVGRNSDFYWRGRITIKGEVITANGVCIRKHHDDGLNGFLCKGYLNREELVLEGKLEGFSDNPKSVDRADIKFDVDYRKGSSSLDSEHLSPRTIKITLTRRDN